MVKDQIDGGAGIRRSLLEPRAVMEPAPAVMNAKNESRREAL
jgi:hypothetical protein